MSNGDGGPPTCPDWWPKLVWDLHYWPRPGGPGPINLPRDVEDLMGALANYTSSYLLQDQEAARSIRNLAGESLVSAARRLAEEPGGPPIGGHGPS